MSDIVPRIQSYLGNGGLFNPELMEHEKVRDLLMDCRTEIERLEKLEKHAAIMRETLLLIYGGITRGAIQSKPLIIRKDGAKEWPIKQLSEVVTETLEACKP
jgi:hypothetical protein